MAEGFSLRFPWLSLVVVSSMIGLEGPNLAEAQTPLLPNEARVMTPAEVAPGEQLVEYFGRFDLIVVGRLESMQSEFTADDSASLATRLTFQLEEVLKGPRGAGEMMAAWIHGGTYLNTETGLVPRRVADAVADAQIGGTYLVVMSADPDERWWVAVPALTRLDGATLTDSLSGVPRWLDAAIRVSKAAMRARDSSRSVADREAFLYGVRAAIASR